MNRNQEQILQATRNGYTVPICSGHCWSESQKADLYRKFSEGIGLSEMALEFNRTEMAVIQQLLTAELLTSPVQRRRRAPKKFTCLCAKCFLREQCPKTEEDCAYAG